MSVNESILYKNQDNVGFEALHGGSTVQVKVCGSTM